MIVAGIGCRRACPATDIIAVLRTAEAQAGVSVRMLAAPTFKSHEPSLVEAASLLGLTLILVEDDAMQKAQSQCQTVSDAALRHTGHASVAEAAAIAAAGPGARLLLPRINNARATCALAESAVS